MSITKNRILEVRNPRTGKKDYQLNIPDKIQIEELTQRLRENQVDWKRLGVEGRVAVLSEWKSVLEKHREELLSAVVRDTGRMKESIREVDNVSKWIDRWSQIAKEQLRIQESPTSFSNITVSSDYSPYPLVGVISPWNFPMSLSLMDAIPALLAGCAVVIKPSEVTPRFVEPIMKTINEVPALAGNLTYVVGRGETGAELIEHVDMVCFTGSVATGRKVAVRAAERFIPAFLELGGKDPAIVLESADLERATSAILVGSVLGAGHQCYFVERIFVAESRMEEFVDILTEKANQLKLAYPSPDSGEIGPIIYAPQAEIIQEQLKDAIEKGATIHCGGIIEELGGGLYCQPTVVTNVSANMKLYKEETFGPIMPVIPFTDIKEAVEMANDSEYGLSGAVFAETVEEAKEVACELEVGGININDTGLSPFFIGEQGDVEKSSFKLSGLGGSRIGSASIKRFVRKKALFSNASQKPSPWWYD